MLFSVIVPVYNAERYLPECVKSVQEQTCGDLELILVDDGSTDGSPELCDAFEAADSRIRTIHKENGGHTSARNLGLKICRGEYVILLDSDDWIEPEALEVCREIIVKYSPQIVSFGCWEECGETRQERHYPFDEGFYDCGQIKKEIFPQLIMSDEGAFFPRTLWGKAFGRELLMEYQKEIPTMIQTGEDMCCIIQVLLHAPSVFILDRALYHYRIIAGSVSRKGDQLAVRRCLELVHYLDRVLPGTADIREQFSRLIVQQMYSAFLRLYESRPSWSLLKQEFELLCRDPACTAALRQASFSPRGAGRTLQWKQRILKAGILPAALAAACKHG